MASYPSTLPAPQIDGYQFDIDWGIRNVLFEHGNRRQRKMFKLDHTVISLSFVFTGAQLWVWQRFANISGYDWHYMDIQTQYSGRSKNVNQHYLRYIGDIVITAIDPTYCRVSILAELNVQAVQQSAASLTGVWIISPTQTAAPMQMAFFSEQIATTLEASEDWYIAGTPANPSIDVIISGSPRFPAAEI